MIKVEYFVFRNNVSSQKVILHQETTQSEIQVQEVQFHLKVQHYVEYQNRHTTGLTKKNSDRLRKF
jgi:hypothetical protein